MSDNRWMRGAVGERGPAAIITSQIIYLSALEITLHGLQMLVGSRVLVLTSKKLTFKLSACIYPPYIHLVSTQMMNEIRPSSFVAALLLSCIIVNSKNTIILH